MSGENLVLTRVITAALAKKKTWTVGNPLLGHSGLHVQ